jgi:hypothetical protein
MCLRWHDLGVGNLIYIIYKEVIGILVYNTRHIGCDSCNEFHSHGFHLIYFVLCINCAEIFFLIYIAMWVAISDLGTKFIWPLLQYFYSSSNLPNSQILLQTCLKILITRLTNHKKYVAFCFCYLFIYFILLRFRWK